MFRIGDLEKEAVIRVIDSGWMFKVDGPNPSETLQFEAELEEKFQVDHAILMTSGYAALRSALVGLGIGPGDEVIVPSYTYIATAMAVVEAGAMPIIAEIDETLTLDPEDVEQKITDRTKAIIPVHIQGFPCNMDALTAVAKKYNLKIIEDSCQSDGGSFHGKRLGTIGDAGALSFNQFKIISAGEGGAFLTNDRTLFERAAIHHDSCAIAYFANQLDGFAAETFCGSEYRSNDLTAAVLRAQLTRLDGILADLRKNKKYIMDALSDDFCFAPSNDIEGDCGTAIAFRFETEAEARAFQKKVDGHIPVDVGKHVYRGWDCIIEKRGALHPAMDPFKMPQNNAPDYRDDMCPKTLDLLARSVLVFVNPDSTTAELDEQIAMYRSAK